MATTVTSGRDGEGAAAMAVCTAPSWVIYHLRHRCRTRQAPRTAGVARGRRATLTAAPRSTRRRAAPPLERREDAGHVVDDHAVHPRAGERHRLVRVRAPRDHVEARLVGDADRPRGLPVDRG